MYRLNACMQKFLNIQYYILSSLYPIGTSYARKRDMSSTKYTTNVKIPPTKSSIEASDQICYF
jgi:hypothetical protein